MVSSRSLRPYFLLEARAFAVRGPVFGLVAGAAMIAITHLAVPRLPKVALDVLEKSFAVQGLPALLLLNDYLALYAALFFGGFAELVRAFTAPREERQLELLLSKPIPALLFVVARAVPVLAALWLVGAALGGAMALAILPISSPASATAAGALGGSIAVASVTVLLLAALTPLLVRSRDGFEALVIGFTAWVLPALPATVYLYRPDLFEGRAALASALVAPANVVWHDASMLAVAPLITVVCAGLTAVLLNVAGRVLRRTGAG
jgi:hypothetical protein